MKKLIVLCFTLTLLCACQSVKKLTGNYSEPLPQTESWTATMHSVINNESPAAVKKYLVRENNVNHKTNYGNTALMFAGKYNTHNKVATELILYGADVSLRNKEGKTALMFAAESNTNPAVINVLLSNKADIADRDINAMTPLMYGAKYNKNNNVFKAIIAASKHKQLINARNIQGYTALMLAAKYNPTIWHIEELLKAGADINATDDNGISVLMLAAGFNSNPKIVDFLLEKGADVHAIDTKGHNVLYYAQFNSSLMDTKAYWRMNNLFYGAKGTAKGDKSAAEETTEGTGFLDIVTGIF